MQINEPRRGFSKREKRLLLLMMVVGFSALMIVYVIIPLYNRLQDETDRYHAVSLEQLQLENLIAASPVIRENHARAIVEFYEARERFLNESHVGEVSRMLTEMCLDHNLDVLSQRLTAPIVPAAFDAFLVMTMSKTVSGHYNDIQRFLDTIERTEYLRITRHSFNMRRPIADGLFDPMQLERVNINLEIIMMQDLDV